MSSFKERLDLYRKQKAKEEREEIMNRSQSLGVNRDGLRKFTKHDDEYRKGFDETDFRLEAGRKRAMPRSRD